MTRCIKLLLTPIYQGEDETHLQIMGHAFAAVSLNEVQIHNATLFQHKSLRMNKKYINYNKEL